ncbi:serine hydrolase [Sphingorhabdus sp. EL138]|uniref:serine hydrolase domain-containing protein n=1 Tax=Sphingorhabdus sp. EL138 TaxID=2073156 RepID=UPI000D68C491|nr:serine hydrolase domain-containing protein [Sphingorhabdus sp. EL138]
MIQYTAFLLAPVLTLISNNQASAETAFSSTTNNTSAVTDAKKVRIDLLAPQWLAKTNVPSVAIAWMEDGKVAWTAVYGNQSKGKSASQDTLYNIASLTKPLVTETILRLADQGTIDLDESMATAWVDPDIIDDPRHQLLTPRMVLQHRTGFPNWRYQTDNKLSFKAAPDTHFGYSGEGFNYVGRFVQSKLKKPFEDLVAETIFRPFGMESTSFTEKPWFAGRVAVPHGQDGKPVSLSVRKEWNAADDVHTTIGDYARFMVLALDKSGLESGLSVSRFNVRDNQADGLCASGRIEKEVCPTILGFGLGWTIFGDEAGPIVMHGGGDVGEHTLAFYSPTKRQGAVIFTNGANGRKVIRDAVKELFPNPGFVAFLTMQAGGS